MSESAFSTWFRKRGVWPRITYQEVWDAATATAKAQTTADAAVLSELHDMLDAVDSNLRVHDLDKMAPQSTLGQTLLELMRAYDAMIAESKKGRT